MATTPLAFPALPSGKNMDSSKFSFSRADPGMRSEMEGGYAVTRSRFTRTPVKTFKVGFTNITEADKEAIDAHWVAARGTSRAFTWTNVSDGITYNVRFKGTVEFTYRGAKTTHFWDCGMELEQV